MEFCYNGKMCPCGRTHKTTVKHCEVGKGALERLIPYLRRKDVQSVYVVSDDNTYRVAGERVIKMLKDEGFNVESFVFCGEALEPDERAVGAAVMHDKPGADILIAVGSGVINDITKICAVSFGKPYFVVATAPSMDGYASNSASMIRDGLKVSLPAICPEVIIGDTDILKTAPRQMLVSGLGDMLAKYVSICEWRISNYVNGEYYCEEVASFVRAALKKCTDNAVGLLSGNDESIEAVFEGLVACGQGMEFAGASRPASGVEHYISHVWDMRGLEFGTPVTAHGIQCAVGTLLAVKLYGRLKGIKPSYDKAVSSVLKFDFGKWSEELRGFLGKSAEAMIAQEKRDGKYDKEKHALRVKRIIDGWEEILGIIEGELPTTDELKELFESVGLPTSPEVLGHSEDEVYTTFLCTKDIRDKYVLSRLAFDLGCTEELFK